MATIWRGSLSFGLVNVPVKVHAATQDNDVSFRQVHATDGGRIRYRRVCEVCGEIVEFHDIAKAYESPTGQTVVVTEDDLATLPAGRSREIDVVEFVPAQQVDPILFDRSYFLEPDKNAVRPYVLLREALKRTERIAIARVALRNKTRLAALRVFEDVLMMQTMLWGDEVRSAEFTVLRDAGDIEAREQELKMAASLIETLEADFDPDAFTDDYRQELLELIDRKLTNNTDILEPSEDTATPNAAPVVDLIAALQASIDRNKGATQSDDPQDSPRAAGDG